MLLVCNYEICNCYVIMAMEGLRPGGTLLLDPNCFEFT